MQFMQFPRTSVMLRWIVIFLIALLLRTWQLGEFPSGLHQDESWFAYNAYLMLEDGVNIYGHRWPLTVDMWGDNVSAIHSYVLMPWIALFGPSIAVFRWGIVFWSLVSMVLAAVFVYRITKREQIAWLTAALFAFSPWNIVMSRASSSVIIDTAVLLVGLIWLYELAQWVITRPALSKWTRRDWTILVGGAVGLYGWTMFNYVVYFTSRLLIPPMYLVLLAVVALINKKISKPLVALSLVVVAYLLFPFAVFLNTPYARGRYAETAVIANEKVKAEIFNHISKSGQAGLHPKVTYVLFNTGTLSARELAINYIGLLSPSVLLFQNGPPIRYHVPQGVSVTGVEYLALLLALGAWVFIKDTTPLRRRWRWAGALFVALTVIAALPSALTADDFPNLQRGVIMTPFWQMAAAMGLWWLWLMWRQQEWWRSVPKKIAQVGRRYSVLLFVAGLVSLIQLIPFSVGYFAIMKYDQPIHRSRAAEVLAYWINDNAHDARIISDHVEAAFLFPYIFKPESIFEYEVSKTGPSFFKSDVVRIGNRTYVRELCSSPLLRSEEVDYYIFFTLHEQCKQAEQMGLEKVFSAPYDSGDEGFAVYRPPSSALE